MTFLFRISPSFRPAFRGRSLVGLLSRVACVLVLASGCSSTRQIETSRPQTIDPADRTGEPASGQARLVVVMEQGDTSLPDEIDRFEFRIAEVRLHEAGGSWIRLPSETHQFTLPIARRARRTVLNTRVTPARYDSVALSFDQLFARFGENAGARLTAGDEPLRLALDFTTSLETNATIRLRFEPGASLRRAPDCRWFFVPVVQTSVE